MVLTFTIFYASMVLASRSNNKTFNKDFVILHPSIQYLELQISLSIPCAPSTIASVPNATMWMGVIRIFSLMDMFKDTQAQSNANFIKDLDFNTLPQKTIKFLLRKFDSSIMFKLPLLETTHMLCLENK